MKTKPKIIFKCKECQSIYEKRSGFDSKVVKYGRFCSMSCKSKYIARLNPSSQRKRIKLNCAFCGKQLELQPYRKNGVKNNFCSRSCTMKYNLKKRWKDGVKVANVVCNYCGTTFQIPVWELRMRKRRGQKQFFCNRQCFGKWKAVNWCLENNPSWKGGWTAHGKGWSIICKVVRREQGYKCLDCGISEKELGRKLDVHHIIPARLFKTKLESCNRSNLMGDCHPCHMKREKASGTISPCQPSS